MRSHKANIKVEYLIHKDSLHLFSKHIIIFMDMRGNDTKNFLTKSKNTFMSMFDTFSELLSLIFHKHDIVTSNGWKIYKKENRS